MDKVDRRIIAQLQMDGRTTLKELARSVGFKHWGVKKKASKAYSTKRHKSDRSDETFLFKLYPAIILLEMESEEAMQKLLERSKDCPRLLNIFKTIRRL